MGASLLSWHQSANSRFVVNICLETIGWRTPSDFLGFPGSFRVIALGSTNYFKPKLAHDGRRANELDAREYHYPAHPFSSGKWRPFSNRAAPDSFDFCLRWLIRICARIERRPAVLAVFFTASDRVDRVMTIQHR